MKMTREIVRRIAVDCDTLRAEMHTDAMLIEALAFCATKMQERVGRVECAWLFGDLRKIEFELSFRSHGWKDE